MRTHATKNQTLVDEFGERLLSALLRRHMTRADLCVKSGLKYDSVTKLARGTRAPNLRTVASIATALGVTVAQLLEEMST
jgi:transcriptional regulator with XRE-family HTH domain